MIPFNAPPVVGTELDYMQSAMGSGKLCICRIDVLAAPKCY